MPDDRISTINLRVLGAASAFASKDETSYYLNGVCLEIDARGVTYVATDGHRLVAYRDEKQPDTKDNLLVGKFIIPTAHCKPHKIGKEEDGDASLFGNGRLTLAYMFVDVTFNSIDGVFPNWRKMIPRGPASGTPAQFNAEYLATFQKFAKALELGHPFVAPNGEGPGCIWFSGRPHSFGIIMPIKAADERMRAAPDWSFGGDDEQSDIEDEPTEARSEKELEPA